VSLKNKEDCKNRYIQVCVTVTVKFEKYTGKFENIDISKKVKVKTFFRVVKVGGYCSKQVVL